ncbi:MAG: hypothetical protein GEU93_02810 [Propionibacteriales bacterium]|nr:hypothetical protein [Propionibacteriales bacterium]
MTERAKLEEQLKKTQDDLAKASHAFQSSVETLAELLGTKDAVRINAAKEAMHTWNETVRNLTEEQHATQRRLEHLNIRELSQHAIRAARSASRAAWATFWVVLFAMLASTTATIMAAVIATTDWLSSTDWLP